MKILFLITKSNWGGAQRYVFDLATHLPTDRYEVKVALGGIGEKGAPIGTLERRLREKQVRTIRIVNFMRNMSPLQDVRAFFEVLALLRHEKPDVLHANSSKAGGIGMLAGFLAGVPARVFTVHGFAFHESRSTITTLLIRFASWCTLFFATHAICVAKSDAEIAAAWPIVGKKISHIPIGLDTFPLREKAQARACLTPNSAVDEIWLGSIAELHPNKNLRSAIEVCAALQAQGKKYKYFIIGSGQEETILRTLIHTYHLEEVVILKGHLPDAAQYLQAFDIVLLPSKKEGLPYIVLETAMAAVPIIASPIPSLKNILTHDHTALLIDPSNTDALAQAIIDLMDNPQRRTQLGKALQHEISEHYSLDTMINATLCCYTPKNSLSASSRGTARE